MLSSAVMVSVLALSTPGPLLTFSSSGDGYLRQTSLTEMCEDQAANGTEKVSDIPLSGYIIGLHLVQNSRTNERFIVGGADDGSVAFWNLESVSNQCRKFCCISDRLYTRSLKLCSRWNLFITPLIHVIQFHDEKVGAVHGCVLCISLGGTIAVIAIDGFQLYVCSASITVFSRTDIA